MKLRHFLPAIALAFPLVSQAESEFSYDYLELSTSYAVNEVENSSDDISGNLFSLGFSKELFFQTFVGINALYNTIDSKIDFEMNSLEFESEGYGYSLLVGRYFKLHNRIDALVSAKHTRFHSEDTVKVSSGFDERKSKNRDVQFNSSIDTGLRIHLDSSQQFELMPNIVTHFYDDSDVDTVLELGFGYAPMKSLQLIATYSKTPEKLDRNTYSAAIRWNF
jgi:hypothetical protein